MIEFLEQCVRIPSLSGQERHVAEFLRDEMHKRGFKSHIDAAGNVVGVIGNGTRQLVMLGHMDTVGGDVPIRYEGNVLYGRGSVDAKGPLCAFILAAAAAFDTGRKSDDGRPMLRLPSADWQLVVIGAVEEESATAKGARYVARSYKPEMCIIGEPSGTNAVTLGYKGRLLVDAHFERESQHTSIPGANPSEAAIGLWNWVNSFAERYNEGKAKAFDRILPSIRKITSGDDGLKEWCDVRLALRLPLEMNPQAMGREIATYQLQSNSGDSPMGGSPECSMKFLGFEPAYRSAKDSTLARAFLDAIRSEKMRPAFKDKSGTSDMNVVGPIWNCPVVAYGPGDSSLDHTPIEHIEIAEFERAVRVLSHTLQILIVGK